MQSSGCSQSAEGTTDKSIWRSKRNLTLGHVHTNPQWITTSPVIKEIPFEATAQVDLGLYYANCKLKTLLLNMQAMLTFLIFHRPLLF